MVWGVFTSYSLCVLSSGPFEDSFCLPLHLHIGMAPRPARMLLKSKWLRYLSSMIELIVCFLSWMVTSQSLREHLPTVDRLKIRTKLNFCFSDQECFLACVCSLGIQIHLQLSLGDNDQAVARTAFFYLTLAAVGMWSLLLAATSPPPNHASLI